MKIMNSYQYWRSRQIQTGQGRWKLLPPELLLHPKRFPDQPPPPWYHPKWMGQMMLQQPQFQTAG